MKTTGHHVVNMFKTKRGEHCLFRSFGINATDDVGVLRKSTISEEVAKWYPAVKSVSVRRTGGTFERGESQYQISIIEE